MSRVVPIVALAIVAVVTGWAGLRPFAFWRPNAVTWLHPGPGLRCAGGGFAYSEEPLVWDTRAGPAGFGLELWLRCAAAPATARRALLVLLDGAPGGSTLMGLRQEGQDLVLWDRVTNPGGDTWYNDRRLVDVLRPGQVQHLAVSRDGELPRFRVDGLEVEAVGGFGIPIAHAGEAFGGTLVVGAGPPWTDPWSGEVYGLVVYDRSPGEEARPGPGIADQGAGVHGAAAATGVLAAYAFDEQHGDGVFDRSGRGPDLVLPAWYRPPGQRFLELPRWEDRHEQWLAADMAWNLLGFLPLGALLVVVLARILRVRRRWLVLLATGTGGGASFLIEWSQSFLVGRNSSLLDLVLNMLGTLTGAVTALAWSSHHRRAAPPGSGATAARRTHASP